MVPADRDCPDRPATSDGIVDRQVVHARDAEDDFDAGLLEYVDDGVAAGVLVHDGLSPRCGRDRSDAAGLWHPRL